MAPSLVGGAGPSTDTHTSFQDTSIATKRRFNLSFDSLKVFPPSLRNTSSQNSQDSPTQLLSPPVSIVIPMSPPPRPEKEDYFMSDRKGKERRKRHQSPLSRNETYSTSVTSEFSSKQRVAPPPSSPKSSEGFRPGNYQSFNDEIRGVYYPPAQPQSPPTLFQLPDSLVSLPPELVAAVDPPILRTKDSLDPSPAIESLRRLSRSRTQPSIEGILDLKRLSRAVTETLTAVFATKEASPVVSLKAKRLAFLNRQGEIFNKARQAKIKEENHPPGGRATPASITLRKASSVRVLVDTPQSCLSSESESDVAIFELPYHLLNSTSNLLTFVSRRVGNRSPSVTSSFFSLPQDRSNSLQSNPLLRNYSFRDNPPGGQTMTKFATLLLDAPPERRRSFIAEAVLTQTIFCPSSARLINPRCHTIAIPPSQTSVRASVVRLISRNSFHEIIWREDEVSSDGTTSDPSTTVGAVIRPTEPLEYNDSSVRNYMETGILLERSAASPSVSNDQSTVHNPILESFEERESQKALFAWTWEQPVGQLGSSSLGKKWDGNAGNMP